MNLKLVKHDDLPFVHERLSILPDAFKEHVLKNHLKNLESTSRREANLSLIDITEKADTAITHRLNRGNINADENDLKAYAKLQVDGCMRTLKRYEEFPLKDAYKQILLRIRENGIEPSSLKEEPTYTDMQSLIRRSLNPTWWLRNLRKIQSLDIERMARMLNLVKKPDQLYVSDENLKRYVRQQKEQQEYLENMIAENEEGDPFLLSELKAGSISDPYVKKSELMNRCRGFENLAERYGHKGVFITITCPSKYHRAYGISGDANPNWNDATPLEAQEYLKDVWARIRSSLDRQDIRVYGFRVAEPHHDGTPHWHMLFFVEPKELNAIKDTFLRYCLDEDGDEKGALANRVKIVDIDPKKGSATGYIAKYIAKNINGEDLDTGIYGENPIIAAQRVTAWASVWGIRQFQQIGGSGVSVWRELRRMEQVADLIDSTLEDARIAADNSDWEGYQLAMGGVNIARADRPISMVYWTEIDTSTGEIRANQYGELKAPSVYGLEYMGQTINTRPHLWIISRAN